MAGGDKYRVSRITELITIMKYYCHVSRDDRITMAAGQINIRMSAMLISGSLPSSCIPLVSALQGLGFMLYPR